MIDSDDENTGESFTFQEWIDRLPATKEELEVYFQRGKEMFNLERDDWMWLYLFGYWYHQYHGLRCTTIWTHKLKMFGGACLETMFERIFLDFSNKPKAQPAQ